MVLPYHYYDDCNNNKNHIFLQIFVIDTTSSEDDLDLAASELQNALNHPSLEHLPVLVLANKQNIKGAISAEKVSLQSLQSN